MSNLNLNFPNINQINQINSMNQIDMNKLNYLNSINNQINQLSQLNQIPTFDKFNSFSYSNNSLDKLEQEITNENNTFFNGNNSNIIGSNNNNNTNNNNNNNTNNTNNFKSGNLFSTINNQNQNTNGTNINNIKGGIISNNTNNNLNNTNNNYNNIYNPNNLNYTNNHNNQTSEIIDYEKELEYSTSKLHEEIIWQNEEDQLLKQYVYDYSKNWKLISDKLSIYRKSPVQCLQRWKELQQPGIMKGPWSIEEDKRLIEWAKLKGASNWSLCSDFIKGRTGKQCRERWLNALNPSVKKGSWTSEEDLFIFKMYQKVGSKWSKIAIELHGRTENSIKNRFYSTLRRIATENKKNGVDNGNKEDTTTNTNTANSSTINKSNINNTEYLLKYIPEAYEEKLLLCQHEYNIKMMKSPKEEIELNVNIENDMNNLNSQNLNITINTNVLDTNDLLLLNKKRKSTTYYLNNNYICGESNGSKGNIQNISNIPKNINSYANISNNPFTNAINELHPSTTNNLNNPHNNNKLTEDSISIELEEAENLIKNLSAYNNNINSNMNNNISNNISNTISNNLVINTTIPIKYQKKKYDNEIKNMSLDVIQEKIDALCKNEPIAIADVENENENEKIDTNISGFTLNQEATNKIVKTTTLAHTKLNHIMGQLNELENILKISKKELINNHMMNTNNDSNNTNINISNELNNDNLNTAINNLNFNNSLIKMDNSFNTISNDSTGIKNIIIHNINSSNNININKTTTTTNNNIINEIAKALSVNSINNMPNPGNDTNNNNNCNNKNSKKTETSLKNNNNCLSFD